MTTLVNKIYLAPMAGITDLPFRIICKELGADVLYSEMVSATGLTLNKSKNDHYINSCQQDSPLFVQLFGSNPGHFAKALNIFDTLPSNKKLAKDEVTSCKPDGIDINFGCPIKKVMKQGAGCALMDDLPMSRSIINAVTENTDLDVSIKIRAGFRKTTALKFVDYVADLPWSTMIVHGRTYTQRFSGEIDFELIKKLKNAFPEKKVIANGGIYSPEDAKLVLKRTAADGIAIARGALGNPWIFIQTKKYLAGELISKPTRFELASTAKKHLDMFIRIKGEDKIREMRKHLGWYVNGLPNARYLRRKIYTISSYREATKILDQI